MCSQQTQHPHLHPLPTPIHPTLIRQWIEEHPKEHLSGRDGTAPGSLPLPRVGTAHTAGWELPGLPQHHESPLCTHPIRASSPGGHTCGYDSRHLASRDRFGLARNLIYLGQPLMKTGRQQCCRVPPLHCWAQVGIQPQPHAPIFPHAS